MAEKKRKTDPKVSPAGTRVRQRLASVPALDAVSQRIRKDVEKLLDKETVQETLTQLAARKRSIEGVLLEVGRGASEIIDSALREEQRVAEREAKLNEQYEASLIERHREKELRKRQKGKKGEYIVSGRLLHPKTGKPVPGMVVEAIDKDISKHDFLGVDTTDSQGYYEIVFRAKDFKESGEGLPEIIVKVSADRKEELHRTGEIVRLEPGERKSIDITLPESKAGALDRILLDRETTYKRRLHRASQTVAFDRIEHTALQEIGSVFKAGLSKAIGFLEARIEEAEKKEGETPTKAEEEKKTELPKATTEAEAEPKAEAAETKSKTKPKKKSKPKSKTKK